MTARLFALGKSFNSCCVLLALGACGSEPTMPPAEVQGSSSPEANAATSEDGAAESPQIADTAPLSAADRARVCRAAIADLNGRDPKIVKTLADDGEVVRVRYTRPDDGKPWTNECRLQAGQVIWRTIDAFGAGGGPGRWRDSAMDEQISYELAGDKVAIITTYSDGSGGTETYTVR